MACKVRGVMLGPEGALLDGTRIPIALSGQVEALRENVRAKVQESLATGKLEEGWNISWKTHLHSLHVIPSAHSDFLAQKHISQTNVTSQTNLHTSILCITLCQPGGLLTLQRKKSQEPGPPPVEPNKSESKGEEDLKKLGQEICDLAAGCWFSFFWLLYTSFWVGIFEFCDELVEMDEEERNFLRMWYIDEIHVVSMGLICTILHLEMHGQYRHVQAHLSVKKSMIHETPPEVWMIFMVISSQTPGGVLQEASKSGKLDEALELLRQEQHEVVQAAPQEQKWMGQFWKGGGVNDGVMYGKTSQVFLEFFFFWPW